MKHKKEVILMRNLVLVGEFDSMPIADPADPFKLDAAAEVAHITHQQ